MSMNQKLLTRLLAAAVMGAAAFSASAQNLAIVNGKAVPKERAEVLKQQIERSGRPLTPEMEGQIKEEVIAREVFMQEAQKRVLEATSRARPAAGLPAPPGRCTWAEPRKSGRSIYITTPAN